MDIRLELRTESDSEFFLELYSKIKSSELHFNDFPEQIKHQILTMQFSTFEKSVIAKFNDSIDYLVLFNSIKAGRLILNIDDTGIRIINISLMPSFQNLGIGSCLISNILKEANKSKKAVFLEVDKSNPAYLWYLKFGFQEYDQNEVKYFMKRS